MASAQRAAASGDAPGCIRGYTQALAAAPGEVSALAGRAGCELAIQDAEGAVQDLDQAVKLSPNDPSLLLSRARAYFTLGNLSRAASDFMGAARLDSANADTIAQAVEGLTNIRFLSDAERAARDGIARYGKDPRLHDDLAKALALDGDSGGATAAFDLAVGEASGAVKAEILADRATFEFQHASLHAALADANAAVVLESSNPSYYETRSTIREALGDLSGAVNDLGSALTLEAATSQSSRSARARLLEERGRLYVRLNERTQAQRDFADALAIVGQSDEAARRTLENELQQAQ